MTIEIVINLNRFAELAGKLPLEVGKIVMAGALDIEAAAKEVHPPNVRTGNLVNSIAAHKTGPTSAEVDVTAEYAAYVEYGTSKMAARPYLTPAAEKVKPQIVKELSNLEKLL